MKAPTYATQEGRLGAGQKCELCGATSGVAKDDDGLSCLACGAPRVLVNADIPRSFAETAELARAHALRQSRAAWGVAAAIGVPVGFLAAIAGVLLGLFVFKDEAARAVVELVGLAPLVFVGFAFWHVRRTTAAVRSALERAELAVTVDVLRARRGIDATELSQVLGVAPTRAEQLLARTEVEQFLLETPESAAEQPLLRVEGDAPSGQSTANAPSQNRTR